MQNDTLLQLEVHLTVLSIDGNLKDSLLLAAVSLHNNQLKGRNTHFVNCGRLLRLGTQNLQ